MRMDLQLSIASAIFDFMDVMMCNSYISFVLKNNPCFSQRVGNPSHSPKK